MSIAGYEIVSATTTVSANSAGQAQPAAPSGKVVLGGGYTLGSPPYSQNMKVRRSSQYYNGQDYFWLVIVDNENSVDYSFTAYAICANA